MREMTVDEARADGARSLTALRAAVEAEKRPKVMTLAEVQAVVAEAADRLNKARQAVEAAEAELAEVARNPGVRDGDLADRVLKRNEARAALEIAERRHAGAFEQLAHAEHRHAAGEVERYLGQHREQGAEFNARLGAVEDAALSAADGLKGLPELQFAAERSLLAAQNIARQHDLPAPHGMNLVPRLSQLQSLLLVAEAIRMSRASRGPKSAA